MSIRQVSQVFIAVEETSEIEAEYIPLINYCFFPGTVNSVEN